MADKKNWLPLLAYVTGSINQELLLRNEYLAAENHILKSQIKGRLRLSDDERATLAPSVWSGKPGAVISVSPSASGPPEVATCQSPGVPTPGGGMW